MCYMYVNRWRVFCLCSTFYATPSWCGWNLLFYISMPSFQFTGVYDMCRRCGIAKKKCGQQGATPLVSIISLIVEKSMRKRHSFLLDLWLQYDHTCFKEHGWMISKHKPGGVWCSGLVRSNPTAVSMSLCPWDTSPQIAPVGIVHSIEYVSRFG